MTPETVKIDQLAPSMAILDKAAGRLKAGDVILHPTETVYGLAARWDSARGLQRIAAIKGHAEGKPMSLLVNSIDQIFDICGWQSPQLTTLLEQVYPGPLTILLERRKKQELSFWNQFPDLGFRLPDHQVSRLLAQFTDTPLVTTSANLTGESSPQEFLNIPPQIRQSVAMALDGGPCLFRQASTIIKPDWENGWFTIIREGAFSEQKIAGIFKRIFHR